MRAVLGIDAAWTERQPSGLALIEGEGVNWTVVCVAPSYDAFIAGTPLPWKARKFPGAWPNVAEIVKATRRMTSADLSVVAVDMPLAKTPFQSRRRADNAISKAFGGRGCSAHSPNASRPGKLGASLMSQLSAEGFPLATSTIDLDRPYCTIEVYPHPALLTLLTCSYRVPYKVSKSGRYWKGTSVRDRISRILDEFRKIEAGLQSAFGHLGFELPRAEDVPTLAALKRFEDALDALVCAWVGLKYSHGSATPYGDTDATIWVP